MDEADYVVIGAGSAGCVVAERLGRDPSVRVAVVEAGGSDRRFWVQVPLGYGKTFYDPAVTWGYRTEPDPGLAGRSDYWPRGRLVGGSGSINAMVWIRGDARDFDDWAALGNPGWSFADVLPVFRAIEDNAAGADAWRGRGGPMSVADVSRRLHPLARRFLEAGAILGHAVNPDFNGATQEGVGTYQLTVRRGWRHSSAKAFLRPAIARGNVSVMTGAVVVRIVTEAGRAVGVEVRRDGETRLVRARREVILSAGAIGSPHLLHLSGIGPAAMLLANGVPVVHDSPAVGRNLMDHQGINYLYRARVPSLNSLLRPWWGKLGAGIAWALFDRGPIGLSLNQAGGFVRTRPDLDRPNIQLYLQAITTVTGRAGTRPLFTPDPFPGFALGLSNCRPTSRGWLDLRSPDPAVPPRIVANALSTDGDIRDAVEGVRLIRRLAATGPLAEAVAEELVPGPSVATDDDLADDFRRRCGTVYHPCGTCGMGPDPRTSVVDARLRVHGIDRLRVIDASIFPVIVSGNTNAPTIMVAAKGADMVVADAR
jgi:choline dehydrogenase